MTIELRENEWAEKMISARELGKKPSETFQRVARYYLDQGYSKKEVRDLLDKFLLRCDGRASLHDWSNSIDKALNRAIDRPAVYIEHIDVTQPEMDKINALEGKQIRRLAFVLLCIAKYQLTQYPNSNYWVSDVIYGNQIMKLANINTSLKRQSAMFRNLRDLGLIQFAQAIDNNDVRVLFAEDGDVAMRIIDFRDLGYQYMMYCGEPYYECTCCGKVSKIKHPGKGRKPKYCEECAAKMRIQQSVNAVMRRRESKTKEATNDMQKV